MRYNYRVEPKKPSLADKLKSLGVKVGTTHLTPPEPARRAKIDSALSGFYQTTRAGETFIHEERYASDYAHGQIPITLASPLDMLAEWANDPRVREMDAKAFAFLDTETSGMAGGTGTYAFLVGAGRFIEGEFVLQQFFMRDPGEEDSLLEALADFLAPCEALVTYNGKSFDAPLLRTRYILHDMPVPFEDYSHVDLLHLARRLWRDRLPSRTLKYIEENVMDAPRTSEEVPGYEIPWLYFDYLRTGDVSEMKGIFYHNAMDIVALAAMFSHTAAVLHDPFDGRIQHGLDFIAVAKLFEDLGHWDEAARLYEQGLEIGLTEADFGSAVKRLSILQKRRGDVEQAVQLWEGAAENGHIYAHVELAKHFEHRIRDYAVAQLWAQRALEIVNGDGELPGYMRAHWQAELEHRLNRLENKLKKNV